MRAFRSIAFAAAAALCAAASAASAASLVVPIDQSIRLNVSGSAASVLVGNPSVADVTVIDSHTLFVSGRGYGATDIVVLDREGRTLYSGDLVVGAADTGRVSVYRGAARTDMACAPGCQPSIRTVTGGGGSGGSSSGASNSGGGAGGLAQAMASAVGGSAP